MSDPFYPTVDIEFLERCILNSHKVNPASRVHVGSTTTFVLDGPQALHKRLILVRELTPGQVGYEQATSLAIRLSFLGPLISWLEENRDWKEGAYIVPAE